MKSRFLLLMIVFFVPNFLIGQECAADLSMEKTTLKRIVDDMVASSEKKSLNTLLLLFKPCVTKPELINIQNTYASLEFDTPQASAYRTIIEKILKNNNVPCVTLGEQVHNYDNNFNERLNDLINAYNNLQQTKPDVYGENHTKNSEIFKKLQENIKECKIDTNKLRQLNDSIKIAGFGSMTVDFQKDFRALLQKIQKGEVKVIVQTGEEVPLIISTKADSLNNLINDEGSVTESNWLRNLLILIGLAIVGYFGYDYYKKQRRSSTTTPSHKSMNKKQRESYAEKGKSNQPKESHDFQQGYVKGKREAKSELQHKITALETANSQLTKKVERLENENEKLRNEGDDKGKSKPYNKPKPTKPIPNYSKTVLYFATPNQNGEFTSKGQSDVKSGASLYKFFISKDNNTAEFEFFNHQTTFKAALDDPNRIIPVCEPQNAYNPDARRIDTIKKGKAKKEGNKWKVMDKAEIKYV